jgi:hypothetical protein
MSYIKPKNETIKSNLLKERSRIFAKYGERLPQIADRVSFEFDKPNSGWIELMIQVNYEEANTLSLSSAYEPFQDMKEWLEDIVNNIRGFSKKPSMLEIDCESYDAVLYYEPLFEQKDKDTGIFYVYDTADNKIWADAYCDTSVFIKSVYEAIINYAIEMALTPDFVEEWVWDAYNSEMEPYNEDSPELKDFFLTKVRSEIVEEYIDNL